VTEKLGESEFKSSNGWLECFRKNHQIGFSEVYGKSVYVWRHCSRLEWKIDNFNPQNIVNGDDMTFLSSVMSCKTLCSNGERCSYAKHLKESFFTD
jgi:hypothetical protein